MVGFRACSWLSLRDHSWRCLRCHGSNLGQPYLGQVFYLWYYHYIPYSLFKMGRFIMTKWGNSCLLREFFPINAFDVGINVILNHSNRIEYLVLLAMFLLAK